MVALPLATSRLIAAAVAAGAMLFAAAPGSPMADPVEPNCTAADLAQISAGVSAAMSAYLFTHPDVNAYFTNVKGHSRGDVGEQLMRYMDANPQTHADLEGIRRPLIDFQDRCR